MLAALEPAVGFNTVWHRRNFPSINAFTYSTTQIWIDPSNPEELFDKSKFWSTNRFAPIRFKRSDYFDGDSGDLGDAVRTELKTKLGIDTTGELRMLTQPRIWGWLFNPITIYLLWSPKNKITAALLEVTNTPWKQRHRYAIQLDQVGDNWKSKFDKKLHVSPFLGLDYQYEFSINQKNGLEFAIDVVDNYGKPIVETRLRQNHDPKLNQAIWQAAFKNFASTYKTSAAIHFQALKLWLKRVKFIKNPEA